AKRRLIIEIIKFLKKVLLSYKKPRKKRFYYSYLLINFYFILLIREEKDKKYNKIKIELISDTKEANKLESEVIVIGNIKDKASKP
ncbi:hypothetical protein N7504_008445, partial [Penicillium tannophilum]